MENLMTAEEIAKSIQKTIVDWHKKNENRPADAEILTDEIKKIRKLGDHREDIKVVVEDLAAMNTEMWHLQDKMRSENDKVVLSAIKIFNPFNQRRNDLIEEIDEIFLERAEN